MSRLPPPETPPVPDLPREAVLGDEDGIDRKRASSEVIDAVVDDVPIVTLVRDDEPVVTRRELWSYYRA